MSRIRVLPVNLRNKISAGEVVERPASVVKELVENAIDAEGTEIRIDILHGGKRMIKVSDNGTGMDREDALMCFERHATSKLFEESGLFNIKSMGFRGEALPSIASVSKVRLITGLRGSPSGISIEIQGGDVKEVRESAFSGTSIEVRDLFFNTPPRRKFLKTNTTELFHIIDSVTREALSHYGIGFTLITDKQETMLLPKASGFRERIAQVYGNEFLSTLAEVDAEYADMKLKAFVSNVSSAQHQPDSFRNLKTHQFIFINSRPVRDISVSHAVYNAYEGMLPKDRHPVFFVFLELAPEKVDFNVHPAKREVRFEDKENIYRFINSAIRDTVKGERKEFTRPFTEMPATQQPAHGISFEQFGTASRQYISGISENLELLYKPSLPFIYLGDTFIAVSGKGGLTLIDHHAAHERILYEKFLMSVKPEAHCLLLSEQIRLSRREYLAILENKDLLNEFGIETDDFGHDTLIVRSLPDTLKGADIRGIIADVAASLIEGVHPGRSLKENLAARIACHSSVRGKEILNQQELSELISELEKTEHPDQCPHGRPTRIFISIDEMKKMFKRK